MKIGDRYFNAWWFPPQKKGEEVFINVTDTYWNGSSDDLLNAIFGNVFLTESEAIEHKQEVYDRIMSMYKVLEDRDEKCV